jgi:DNA-binding NtrC family response regulator
MNSPAGYIIEDVSEDPVFMAGSLLMRKLRVQAERVAKIDVPVLIVGESGSGKENTARLIHRLSSRYEDIFLKISCAALPESVLESELFGSEHRNGSDVNRVRQGKFELCQTGTLLLDEIVEMPSALQAKIVHVLQEKHFFRVGGDTAISTDTRIIAATNQSIERALAEKRLREDLYYRLSAFTVHVPPVRERKEEIPVLLAHFIQQAAKRHGLSPRPLSPLLLRTCHQHSWPGNLRELENVAKRYLVMGDEFLEAGDLGMRCATQNEDELWPAMPVQDQETANSTCDHSDPAKLKNLLRSVKGETEKTAIASTLEKTHWNRKAAARELGISYRGLLYKIQEYELIPPGDYFSALHKNASWKRSEPAQ